MINLERREMKRVIKRHQRFYCISMKSPIDGNVEGYFAYFKRTGKFPVHADVSLGIISALSQILEKTKK